METIAEGPLVDFDFKMDSRRDSVLSINDAARKLGVLINIKGVKPELAGECEDQYIVVPPRRVLVAVMRTGDIMSMLSFMVEGVLDYERTVINKDTIQVVFRGEDGMVYTMCYGMQSETAVFNRTK
jgi:hypothetical protein